MSPVWIVLALLPILGGAQRFNCRGRILGAYYADAKSGCKAFHVCVRVAGGGVRDFRFFCPPGTLFHQEAQTCTDWGDDDALACPADIYDGQFDLYKIGSGFDTKKVPSSGNREEEPEFGLQKAETGDRRLSQNSDLRAAHSSDFFTGQRDRGRDESATQTQPPISSPTTRQSFRRATTSRVTFTTTPHTTTPPPPPKPSNPSQYDHSKRKLVRKRPVHTPTPPPTTSFQNTFPPQTYSESPQQNFNRRNPPQNKQSSTTVNIPAQYKDEYVEVSKVTPKQNINRYYPNSPTPTPFSKATQAPAVYKKENPVELYNYNGQSTPGLSKNNDNRPFKLKNSFNVQADVPKDDFARIRNFNGNNNRVNPTSTVDYNIIRGTSTPAYKNINSVSYDSEKNNFGPFLGPKQSHFNNPTSTSPTTTYYTTTRVDPPANLNTVAYNTNIGFNTQSSPVTEFYSTTVRLQTEPPTQRTFDYYQTYTTTSRPYEAPSAQAFTFGPPAKQTTLSAPKATERYQSRETAPPTSPPSSYVSKSTRPPYYAKPSNKKEDNSYDYAYYDSDPGFSEYDHIEEFGRTKTRV
ncbi:mucin-2-like isoform X2 [Vanessa atalanta]|uniref:mucin-2-like isoform X2 n=1 Tax=Vanessa atalanta TaxID=42275 RepID=UPI001FCD1B08|nr:mucin-2-like isoform X2 [Vanessa atalanta]